MWNVPLSKLWDFRDEWFRRACDTCLKQFIFLVRFCSWFGQRNLDQNDKQYPCTCFKKVIRSHGGYRNRLANSITTVEKQCWFTKFWAPGKVSVILSRVETWYLILTSSNPFLDFIWHQTARIKGIKKYCFPVLLFFAMINRCFSYQLQ